MNDVGYMINKGVKYWPGDFWSLESTLHTDAMPVSWDIQLVV